VTPPCRIQQTKNPRYSESENINFWHDLLYYGPDLSASGADLLGKYQDSFGGTRSPACLDTKPPSTIAPEKGRFFGTGQTKVTAGIKSRRRAEKATEKKTIAVPVHREQSSYQGTEAYNRNT